jgi:pimeloyl-ACP methyl ester carboxylesterase
MGHSFGGLIVQLLMDRGLGAAAVSIGGVTPKGVWRLPFSAMKAAAPVLRNPLNYWRTVMLTRQQFRYAFANVMTTGETDEAYDRYAVPGPGRPVFEQAFANLSPNPPNAIDRARSNRAPLLLIAGAADHQVPPAQNLVNHTLYAPSKALTSFQESPSAPI